MHTQESLTHDQDTIKAHNAAQEAAAELCFDSRQLELSRVSPGVSWMFFNRRDNNEPDIAIKVEPDHDGSLQKNNEKVVTRLEALRERGAPLHNNLILPRRIGNFVVSITEYLPGSYKNAVDFRDFGAALAAFHAIPLDSSDDIPRFEPFVKTKKTLSDLAELRTRGIYPRLDELVFDDSYIDKLAQKLCLSEEAYAELISIQEQKGQELSLVHGDINPFNAMINKQGETILIDIDHCATGPWAYDLARPLDHWLRFGRNPQLTNTFRQGYESSASWKLDDKQVLLGTTAALARFTSSLMPRVIKQILNNEPPDQYHLSESMNRISGNYKWHSLEDYINEQRCHPTS